MADTTTTNYGLTKPEVGASEDTWGTKINTNLDTLDTTVDSIQGKSGAGVLKHTNNTKLATTSTGIDITGNATFADNGKAIFGAGSDLQIYHDGSNSYIDDAGTGNLRIRGSQVILEKYTGETILQGIADGSVYIFHDNAEKLATTSTGIDVTGTATMDGLTVDGDGLLYSASNVEMRGNANVRISLGTAGTSGANNNSNWIYGNGTNLRFNNAGGFYSWETLGTERMRIDSSGNVGIGASSVESTLHLQAASAGGRGATLTIDNNASSTVGNESQITFLTDAGASVAGIANARIKAINTNAGSGAAALTFTTWNGSAEGERMRIDASGNVGIGGTPSSHRLEVKGGNNIAKFYSDSTASELKIASPTVDVIGLYTGTSDALTFGTASTERMRIDSSGNLLVGMSSSNYAVAGSQLGTGGNNFMTRSGAQPLLLNRLSNDGDIALFMKDGTAVGSIGTESATTYYAGKYAGLKMNYYNASSSVINPVTPSGVNRDGVDDLGFSVSRFRDLFLSGGVYLGGTGAANKLDDYEEGTWTPVTGPTSSTATYQYRSGYYTKVGNLVTCTFGLKHNGGVWTSGEATISGLPFTADTTGSYQEPQFIVTSLGLAPTSQGGSAASGAFNLGEVSFYLSGTQGRGRSYTLNADTTMGANAVFATNSFIKATIIYHSS